MKVAVVHDWFFVVGGAEKVLESLLEIYPDADVFFVCADLSLVKKTSFLIGKNVKTTFLQKFPFLKKLYRSYLPLMPLAIEQLDLSAYDLIVSSSHAVAKGVLSGPDQLHVSYVHSPMRYAWDMQHQYLNDARLSYGPLGFLTRWLLHKIRLWDFRSAVGVDYFIANSGFIARRVWKTYRRESAVIYPPVDIDGFSMGTLKGDFYLFASRMVPYKRADIVIEAFRRMPDKKLVVIGDGPELKQLQACTATNISFLGFTPFEGLKKYMQEAKAFVFAAEEDFGITPVEAQACGTPVIAYGKGGALETVIESPDPELATGVFFHQQTPEQIIDAVARFENLSVEISPITCRKNAEKFSKPRFAQEMKDFVLKVFSERKRLS